MAAIVVQFGFAMMPLGGFTVTCGLTSLTTSGTSGCMRHADELSMTMTPAAANRGASSFELVAPEGRAKVAVRVDDLGNGSWRYHYALMNFDFARGVTQGSEPNLRVVRNDGFNRFAVRVGASTTISQIAYADGDPARADDLLRRLFVETMNVRLRNHALASAAATSL